MEKTSSTNPEDYEVLIRRRAERDYAAYCPQLNYMLKGEQHEEVAELMKEYIHYHIKNLLSKQ